MRLFARRVTQGVQTPRSRWSTLHPKVLVFSDVAPVRGTMKWSFINSIRMRALLSV